MTKWLITGANGNLGRALIPHILEDSAHSIVSVVRSRRALEQIEAIPLEDEAAQRLAIKVVDYTDVDALAQAAQGCDCAVHLVGILKESAQASYAVAHEQSTEALVEALTQARVPHLTYLSIVGSHPDASNACLASKGRAEQICLSAGQVSGCVIRVPMVLGEGDYASFALKKRALSGLAFTFRAQSKEQPIYAGDVVKAVYRSGVTSAHGALDLGGPEVVTRRELTRRAGAILGHEGRLVSLPIGFGFALARLFEKLMANPPFTHAMLDVLDHDDEVDPQRALQILGLDELTSLNDTLKAVL